MYVYGNSGLMNLDKSDRQDNETNRDSDVSA